MFHGPRNSSEECKVINVYSGNYAVQQPHTSTESRTSGKPKCVKVVEFNENTQESNVIQNDDIPIPRNKKGKKVAIKKRKIKSVKADSAEKGCTYGIDSLNLAETVHADNDSEG